MSKKLLMLLAVSLFSCGSFAANVKNCPFPQHVTVNMPAGFHILEAKTLAADLMLVTNITQNSFDVVLTDKNTSCDGGAFYVRVGDKAAKVSDKLSGNQAWVSILDHGYPQLERAIIDGAGTGGKVRLWPNELYENGNNIKISFSASR